MSHCILRNICVYHSKSTWPCMYGPFLESVKPVTNTILFDEEIKESIFYIVSWNKKVVYLLLFTNEFNSESTYTILRTTYLNNFLCQLVTVTKNIHSIYLKVGWWEINGILELDALMEQNLFGYMGTGQIVFLRGKHAVSYTHLTLPTICSV